MDKLALNGIQTKKLKTKSLKLSSLNQRMAQCRQEDECHDKDERPECRWT